MSHKSSKLKHPMFEDRAIFGFYQRALEHGFDEKMLEYSRRFGEDPDDLEAEKQMEALYKDRVPKLFKLIDEHAGDPVKMYKYMDSAMLYTLMARVPADHKISFAAAIGQHIMQNHGTPGFEPLGPRAPQVFYEFIVNHFQVAGMVSGWAYSGKNIYVIDKGLSDALMNTKLDGFPCDSIQLPHRSVYIAPPRGFLSDLQQQADVDIWGVTAQDTILDGVYVKCVDHSLFDTEPDTDNTLGRLDLKEGDRALFFTVMGSVQSRTGRSQTSTLLDKALILRSGEKFVDSRIVDKDGNLVTEHFDAVQRLIAGVLIYLTWSNADELLAQDSREYRDWLQKIKKARGSKRAKKMQRAISQAQRTSTKFLSVAVIDRHTEKDPDESPKTHASPVPHHRCGHFRAQPYGSKKNPRYKTIWIKPQMIGGASAGTTNLPNVKVVR